MSNWKIIGKEKVGNKVTYKCQDTITNETREFTKDDIIARESEICNVYIQNYKGQKIIRIKGNDVASTKSSTARSSSSNDGSTARRSKNKIYMIDMYKNMCKEFGIRSMEEALAIGFDLYDLDMEIDTRYLRDYSKLQYKVASTIKKIADKENNDIIMKYKENYERFNTY